MKKFRALSSIVLAVCLLFLCSCGGYASVESVEAKAMFNNRKLSLPLPSDRADISSIGSDGNYGFMGFASDQTGEELYHTIQQLDPSLTCTLGDHYILISRENDVQANDYYLIYWYKEHWYSFTGMRAGIITGVASNKEKQRRAVLLPYHLVSDDRVGVNFSDLYLNAEYETTAGAEEFYQFYADSGWYDVELKDGCVLLNGYKHPDAVIVEPEDFDRYGTLKFDKKLKIQFREFEDMRYFSFIEAE